MPWYNDKIKSIICTLQECNHTVGWQKPSSVNWQDKELAKRNVGEWQATSGPREITHTHAYTGCCTMFGRPEERPSLGTCEVPVVGGGGISPTVTNGLEVSLALCEGIVLGIPTVYRYKRTHTHIHTGTHTHTPARAQANSTTGTITYLRDTAAVLWGNWALGIRRASSGSVHTERDSVSSSSWLLAN